MEMVKAFWGEHYNKNGTRFQSKKHAYLAITTSDMFVNHYRLPITIPLIYPIKSSAVKIIILKLLNKVVWDFDGSTFKKISQIRVGNGSGLEQDPLDR